MRFFKIEGRLCHYVEFLSLHNHDIGEEVEENKVIIFFSWMVSNDLYIKKKLCFKYV